MPTIRDHPRVSLKPLTGALRAVVCWYRRKDGRCLGQMYFNQERRCQIQLLAKVDTIEQVGVPTSRSGHPLNPERSGKKKITKSDRDKLRRIHEFSLPNHRFLYFRSRNRYFITNGNLKDAKNQESDYATAIECFDEFENDPDTKFLRETLEDRINCQ